MNTPAIYEVMDKMIAQGEKFSLLPKRMPREKWSDEELVRLREAFAPPAPVRVWVDECCFELHTIKPTKEVKL